MCYFSCPDLQVAFTFACMNMYMLVLYHMLMCMHDVSHSASAVNYPLFSSSTMGNVGYLFHRKNQFVIG